VTDPILRRAFRRSGSRPQRIRRTGLRAHGRSRGIVGDRLRCARSSQAHSTAESARPTLGASPAAAAT